MNGESQEILHEFDIRLSTLQATLVEKWENHDKLADERHKERQEVFKALWKSDKTLTNALYKLPCEKHKGFFAYAKWHLGILTTIILLIIAALFKVSI